MTTDSQLTLEGLIHDLNNVFQTMMEAADLLSEDPRWQSVSAVMLRSAERGKEISASLQTCQPAASIETVVHNARTLLEDSLAFRQGPRISVTCDLEPGLVLADAWAWERVLINLFSNAARAMPGGGTIFVAARRVDACMEIRVADDGSGIAPDLIATIFDPEVSTRAGGGLGLHIVQSIVRQQQGEVRAANRPGKGAEFVITIPMEPLRARRALA